MNTKSLFIALVVLGVVATAVNAGPVKVVKKPPPVRKVVKKPPPPPKKAVVKKSPPPPPDFYGDSVNAAEPYGQVYAFIERSGLSCANTGLFSSLMRQTNIPAKQSPITCTLINGGIALSAPFADINGFKEGAKSVYGINAYWILNWATANRVCGPDLVLTIKATIEGNVDTPDAIRTFSCNGARGTMMIPALCDC